MTLETRDAVFGEIAKKLIVNTSAVARSLTLVYKSIDQSTKLPEKFATFYNQEKSDSPMALGEHAIELLQIFKKYLELN